MKFLKNNSTNVLAKDVVDIDTLILGNSTFKLKQGDKCSYIKIGYCDEDEDDGTIFEYIEIYADFSFEEGTHSEYNHKVSPSFCINPMNTKVKTIDELVGMTLIVESFEESDEREDTMYLYEHEPFMNYSLTIIELNSDTARVKCSGVACIGYTETEDFVFDCWVTLKNSL